MKNFKTLHDVSLKFMKEIFYRFPNLTHRKDNLYVHTRKTIELNKIEQNRISFPNILLTTSLNI